MWTICLWSYTNMTLESFTAHINAQDPHIKFTIEPEQNSSIPFLDTEIVLNDDASIKTKVYRKPTHTDQYLNWSSNHHLEHKRSVVRTLIQRAETLITSEKDRSTEMDHIKTALGANGYKPWILNLPKKKEKKDPPPSETAKRERIHPIALPYINSLSENLQRLFRDHNIPTYHKPFNTLKSLLVNPKDPIKKENQCGLIYHIKCQDCGKDYIGETGRNLGTRFKEHTSRKGTNSAIKEHLENTGHKCTLDNTKIIDKEANWYRRKIKEAIHIQRHNPSLNRDKGLELAPVYSPLLSRDPRGSRDTSAPQHIH